MIVQAYKRETGFEAICCYDYSFQIVRLVSRILMLSNGVKVVFKKCGCSHEVGGNLSTFVCTCTYIHVHDIVYMYMYMYVVKCCGVVYTTVNEFA